METFFLAARIDRATFHKGNRSPTKQDDGHINPAFIAEQGEAGTVALRNCHKHSRLGAVPHGPRKSRACILDHNITV
jgi:hypothetical protein